LSTDGITLLSLVKGLTVPSSILSSWNSSDSNPCQWQGIECDSNHNVITLNMSSNNILGRLGKEIGQLEYLETIDLNNNNISGVIPSELANWNCTKLEELYVNDNQLIGNLPVALNKLQSLVALDVSTNRLDGRILFGSHSCKNLTSLVLSFNRFRGEIPDLGNCTSLTQFTAVNNSLTGTIPSSIGLLSELLLLYLSGNSLSGNIPPEIGNCSSLVDLQLYENQLEGVIPSELGMLGNLQILFLYSNKLSGEFPPVLWTIPPLQSVIVYRNNLSGVLPPEITELHELQTVLLYENQFSGDIPQGLGINSSLDNLDFTNNMFTGEIPQHLCFGKQLRFLNLGSNQLQGHIPSDIGNCTTLQRLRLRNNSLTGPLPEFAENSSLSLMDIHQNRINGAIPSSLMNCANLSSLYLSKNELTGPIPGNLGNLVILRVLNLSSNSLQGPLPPRISKCVDLFSLDVSFNSLNGSIPVNLRSLTRLNLLILGQNNFTGEIPDIFSELTSLLELQLGGNMFGGEIPSSLGQLQNLAYALNLSNNNLTGQIPPDIERLIMLQRLDISQNNLIGSLAPLDKLTSLVEVNVSYNRFEGPIPTTLLKFLNSSSSSFWGNQGLCFPCQSRGGLSCSDDDGLSPCEQLSSQPKRGISTAIIVIIAVGSLVLFVIVLSLFGCYFLRFRRSEHQEVNIDALVGSSIDLRDLMIATEDLNESFIIGRGAHGVVYKVALGSDKLYALKKLDFGSSRGASTSMVKEIQTVGQIRHRNLVKVKDFWFKKDYGLILYKYMPNGSLHDVLYEISPALIIEWDVRYKIALGIAQGLEYLHHDCDPIIVHRDIKPKNILLDSEMEPHISDFGIAKLLDQSSSSMDTVSVVGTTGYLAPETAYTTIWRKESDVYSYGVVLLELIIRKQALDSSFEEGINIVNWAGLTWNIKKSMDMIVDPSLMEIMNPTDMEEVIEIFFLALRCTAKQPNERPTMRDVVKHITDIRTRTRSIRSVV
ncbi:hypothetical protein AQUCO_00600131v1, partial [Aquilegia coerulea]